MIGRLQVRLIVGEISSPELAFCTDSYSMSVPPGVTTMAHKRPQSFSEKSRWQVTPEHAYTLDPTNLGWADYGVQA